jgi:hypothetical protein
MTIKDQTLVLLHHLSLTYSLTSIHSLFTGSVYLFYSVDGQWSQQQKLIASDGMAVDQFGWTISLYGNNLLIGSPQDDDQGTYSGYFLP